MNILALETSSRLCSASIYFQDSIFGRALVAGHAHAELILPMIESVMLEAHITFSDIDAIAFGRGPGSFSGVRIATAIAQGLAFGAHRPIVPVSSLMALAAGAYRVHGANKILVCMDARMGQVYWCAYSATKKDQITACMPEALTAPEEVQPPESASWFRVGSGFEAYHGVFTAHMGSAAHGQDTALLPEAREIMILARRILCEGGAVSAEEALPVYLRDQVAKSKSEL